MGRCWRWSGRYCAVALALSGCDDNNFQSLNEQSKTAWSEVLNQYQRQALDTARCAPRTLTWRSAFWLASADARPREEGR